MTTDIFNVQRGIVGKGAGDDTYILSPELIDADAEITITDAAGANTIQLIGGLSITSSSVAANAVQLTLSNGAVVTVLDAASYTFAVGGNPLTGVEPSATHTFAEFSADVLGVALPTSGTAAGGSFEVPADVVASDSDDTDYASESAAFEAGKASVDVSSDDTDYASESAAFDAGVESVETADEAVAAATDFETLEELVAAYNEATGQTAATFSIAESANTVAEGGSITYTVTLGADVDADTTLTVSVQGSTLGGAAAAAANADFTVDVSSITFAAGSVAGATQTFTVTAATDTVDEGLEGIQVSLLDASFATVATETSAITNVAAADSPTVQAFTTGTDALTGGSAGDTYNAVLQGAGATGTTIAPGDTVSSGAGEDALTIAVAGDAGGAYTLSAIQTTDLEKVVLSNFDTNAAATTVDAALMSGLTTVGLSSSGANGDTTFSNVTNIVDAEMRNGSGDLTIGYGASVVSGSSDSQSLTVSNVTAGTFTVASVESVTITTELVASTLTDVTIDDASSLTILGDKNLTISNDINFKDATSATAVDGVVDASGFTGNLTMVLSSNDVMTVTGGSGNDSIDFGANLTSADTVDMGDGSDTVKMDAATLTTQLNGVSNAEKIQFNAATSAVAMDVSKLPAGVEEVVLDVSDNDGGAGTSADSTVTNLGSQIVTIKHSTADVEVAGGDGVQYTLSGASDTASDSVTVKLDAIGATSDNLGVETLVASNYETVNIISQASSTVTANVVDVLTSASATSVVVTGDAALTISSVGGGEMTSFDAGGMTAGLTATFAGTDDLTITMPNSDSTVSMGTTLNASDSIVGGSGTADIVNADVSGLTATTGALSISNVETINLDVDTAATTINAAAITGASAINTYVDAGGTSGALTITNLASGTTVGLGRAATYEANGSVTISLADATGSADALTVAVNANDTDDDIDAALTVASVETVTIAVNASTKDVQLDVSGVAATSIVATGGLDGEELDLTNGGTTKLHAGVTSVDASAAAGHVIIDASATSAAAIQVTVNGSTTGVNTVTTGTNDDTVTSSGYSAAIDVLNGGTATGDADVLNIGVKNGFADAGSLTNFETINVDVKAGDDVTLTTGFTDTQTETINITGGNSLSTFTTSNDTATSVTLVDASTFGGNVVIGFAAGIYDDTVEVRGGALATDKVVAVYTADPATTLQTTTSGVETLHLDTVAVSMTVDVSSMAGLTTVHVDDNADGASADTISITKLAAGQNITLDTVQDDTVVEAVLADARGSSDSIQFTLSGDAETGATLKTTDIETVTLVNGTATEVISIDQLSMTAASTYLGVVVTGDEQLTIDAIHADINSIDASAMTGALVMTGTASTGITITGGSAGDTLLSGAGNDTLIGGAGADEITGGVGSDTLTGGSGADDFNILNTESNKFIFDTITDFGTGDTIDITIAGDDIDAAETALGTKQVLSSAATLADYLDLIATGDASSDNGTDDDKAVDAATVEWFQFGGNTYIGVDNGAGDTFATATDSVVMLEGEIDLSASTYSLSATVLSIDYVAV